MQTTTLLTLLTAAIFTLAAPAPVLNDRGLLYTIYPDQISTYNVNTGAIDYDVQRGLVRKGNGGIVPTTTLATYTFPPSSAGMMCEFFFHLDATGTSTGSQRAQLFTSLTPADQSTTGWPSGNLRDIHQGDLFFEVGRMATWTGRYGDLAKGKFPCPAGQRLAGELVGRWDEVEISWDKVNGGPYIEVSTQ